MSPRTPTARISRFDDRGATAVEYGLIIGFLAVVMAVGVALVGGRLGATYATAAETLGTAAPGDPASAQEPAEVEQQPAKAVYGGTTPKSNYASNLGNSGSYALPAIAGIQYSMIGCSSSGNDGCDTDKLGFTGTSLVVDSEWGKEKRKATVSISWLIPESATTSAASGSITVRLT